MRLSQFKKKRYLRLVIDLDDLEVYPAPYHKLVKLVKDDRSFVKDGHWHVYPVGFSMNRKILYIVCPYCGEIHGHSNGVGSRVIHCRNKDNENYIIAKGVDDEQQSGHAL